MGDPVKDAVVAYALALPGAYEDFPWGERVAKVGKKVFAFLGKPGDDDAGVGFSVKLPHSAATALEGPHATPTGYGLGKAGWVSFDFPVGEAPPLETLVAWVRESYVAVAPKKLACRPDCPSASPRRLCEALRPSRPRPCAASGPKGSVCGSIAAKSAVKA